MTRSHARVTSLIVGALCLVAVVGALRLVSSRHDKSGENGTTNAIRAAFYYPWYPETENWATHYDPILGKYDSSSVAVVTTHVTEAKYAGLDAFIASWWGPGSKTAARLPLLLKVAGAHNFRIAPYYEPEGVSPAPAAASLRSDLDNLYNQARHEAAWLTVNGKPVLFVYNTGTQAACAAVVRMKAASAGRFYLDMKVFANYASCASQPDSWHQYDPAVAYDRQGAYAVTVSPGFYKFSETRPRLLRDLATFKLNVARCDASATKWHLITTFNEWGEGTSVEPASQWRSASGFGVYLDALHAN